MSKNHSFNKSLASDIKKLGLAYLILKLDKFSLFGSFLDLDNFPLFDFFGLDNFKNLDNFPNFDNFLVFGFINLSINLSPL